MSRDQSSHEFLEYDRSVKIETVNGKTVVGDSTESLYEYLIDNNLSDGLPVIPPTAERVKRMLTFTDRDPQEAILEMETSGAPLTVEKLAVNAVMAGCKPEYLQILITAFECMKEPDYNLSGAATTRGSTSNLILVSGPLAREVGISGGVGCMGPGFRANATIGRAANLALITVGWVVPGVSRSCFATPARYSFCFSEQQSEYPKEWKPINGEFFDAETTSVTCQVSHGPQSVAIGSFPGMSPQHILTQVCEGIANLSSTTVWCPSTVVVVLNSECAKIIADAGWTKEDVRLYVYDHARHPIEAAQKVWPRVFEEHVNRTQPWARFAHGGRFPAITHPNNVCVAVAGGPNAGEAATVIRAFSYGPRVRMITKPVAFKDGRRVKTVKELER